MSIALAVSQSWIVVPERVVVYGILGILDLQFLEWKNGGGLRFRDVYVGVLGGRTGHLGSRSRLRGL